VLKNTPDFVKLPLSVMLRGVFALEETPMEDKSRIPEAVEGIQVNFCKNPRCENFGIAASVVKQPKGPGIKNLKHDVYKITGKKKCKGHFHSDTGV